MGRKPELTDEEIRIRSLIRELHEGVQAAKEATAMFKAERNLIETSVEKEVASAVDRAVKLATEMIQRDLDAVGVQVQRLLKAALDAHTSDDFMALIGKAAARELRSSLDTAMENMYDKVTIAVREMITEELVEAKDDAVKSLKATLESAELWQTLFSS
jgi:hypothetical protein